MSLSDMMITISEEVVFEKVGDEMVLLNLETGAYFGLNPSGSRMWELLVATKSPVRVVESMHHEYDVAVDVLEQDLANLISELKEKKLIEVG
ncbi:PqqD family protein [Methylococcus sp. ANG]|uniref:PqqD family protein n=1 Tax=unclassified Methylococcus TaxID=2618889 RepID=UPI001C527BE0|nr:PqqD family protein [Methylococcus sp. Mc7]QXP82899.1 PqqD family protein [Methylococcus sp. Mc7]